MRNFALKDSPKKKSMEQGYDARIKVCLNIFMTGLWIPVFF
jgi:hypothetical protein